MVLSSMDSKARSPQADGIDTKTAFRKPSTDIASRKYRRHSPPGGSSSSDGSPRCNRSPVQSREDDVKVSENHRRREGGKRESDRDSGRNHSSRSGDIHRSDRRPPSGYSRHDRDVDDRERKYQRSPIRSGRESGSGHHSDHMRAENGHGRFRDNSDRYSRHKYGSSGHSSKEKERAVQSLERKEQHRRGSEWHDEKRDSYRNSGDRSRPHEERRKHAEFERMEKDISRAPRDQYEDIFSLASENHGSPAKKVKPSNSEKFSETANAAEIKQPSSSKSATVSGVGASPGQFLTKESGFSNDVDAAKVAALKAAELVNRNLVGTGYLTTDQKKKLLWGNKKSTGTEESAHRWDATLIGDRERQEKFNKLMGVKGNMGMEQGTNHQNQAEKQKELQLDLEKQYTAGLRRRDGRTVGLGL